MYLDMIKGIDHTLHRLLTSKLTQQTRPYAVLLIFVAVETGNYPTRNNLVFYYFVICPPTGETFRRVVQFGCVT